MKGLTTNTPLELGPLVGVTTYDHRSSRFKIFSSTFSVSEMAPDCGQTVATTHNAEILRPRLDFTSCPSRSRGFNFCEASTTGVSPSLPIDPVAARG